MIFIEFSNLSMAPQYSFPTIFQISRILNPIFGFFMEQGVEKWPKIEIIPDSMTHIPNKTFQNNPISFLTSVKIANPQ